MSLRALGGWVVDRFLGNAIEERVAERIQAAGLPAARQREDDGYRRLTESRRDLPAMTHDRMIEVAVYLGGRNPLARRILDLYSEWIVGEGVKLSSSDPRTKAFLLQFWNDPVNRWKRHMEVRCRELHLFGEQAWPVFGNPYSGIMRLGVLDPAQIKEVVTDPGNATVPIGVVTKGYGGGRGELRLRTVLLGPPEQVLSPHALLERERFADGEIQLHAINKLSTAKRGVSELFALADSVDGYEQLLFSMLARNRALASYFWDYELTGFSQDQINEYMAGLMPPRPFSSFGHNEKVKRRLVGPEMGSAANDNEAARLQRNHILGGAGIGEHHYGGGGDVNRSTSGSMDEAMVKSMSSKQRRYGNVVEDTLAAQVERGIEVGFLRDTPETREFNLTWPDISTRDLSRIGAAFQAVANAAVLLRSDGLISDEVIGQFVGAMGAHIGVEVDVEDMLEKARRQQQDTLADQAGRGFDRRLAS
jgi:hypothetical protein